MRHDLSIWILVASAFTWWAVGAVSAAATSYTYDDAGRLIRVDYTNGASISYVYDANGNLLERTVAGPAGALYLNGDRFKVEVSWETFDGETGAGEPVELTDDSGYFWFFGPDNIELVTKVLDACSPPFNRFWVFTAGLTNVGVTMTVTDTVAQQQMVYTGSVGEVFAPILDTDAFATCDDQLAAPEGTLTKELLRAGGGARSQSVPRSPTKATAMYLNGDRFKVEVSWETFDGETGLGEPVELTDDSGYFWFFGPDNIELVTKVLDACSPPFNRFWVFTAGLTNVGVTMTVTDTVAQQQKVYTGSVGEVFAPILDTDAFATCETEAVRPSANTPLQ